MLERIAAAEGVLLSALVAQIDAARPPEHPLASRLRVTALHWMETSRSR